MLKACVSNSGKNLAQLASRRHLLIPDKVGAVLCVHPRLQGGQGGLHHNAGGARIPLKAHV